MSITFLLLFCLIAVIFETAFFWMFGYDSRDERTVVACTNVLTTLAMNLVMIPNGYRSIPLVAAAELILIAAEFGIYSIAFGRSGKLLMLTIAANAISFGIGLLL
jgi:hypothetical protein